MHTQHYSRSYNETLIVKINLLVLSHNIAVWHAVHEELLHKMCLQCQYSVVPLCVKFIDLNSINRFKKIPAFGCFVPHRGETNLLGLHLPDSLGDRRHLLSFLVTIALHVIQPV